MRTQSIDTHPDVEQVLITLLRQAPIQKRFQSVQALTRSAGIWASVHAWLRHHPEASMQEAGVHYVASAYGNHLARLVQDRLVQQEHWQVQPIDILAVLKPILSVFTSAGIAYYLGGSLASSLHGMQQLAQDIDLVIHPQSLSLSYKHLWTPTHITALKEHYAIDEDEVQRGATVSLLHLDSLLKIDVIVPQKETFDLAMAQLIEMQLLDEHHTAFPVASATEMILWKLAHYHTDKTTRHDGMEDDAGWNDVLGMLKVQGPQLNTRLLIQWAKRFAIGEVLQQAFFDAGVSNSPVER
ncbi:MAG: hypothetical protein E6J34_17005 [Chloroflexi bacterium]|nr:MAG: hypothetical protein E6J34_17005 [Chloroflexota bacterium]